MALGKTKASDLKLIISFALKESRKERVALYHILLPVFIITIADEGVMLFHYVNCQSFFTLKLLSTELTYIESILWG
jgi:hypothetical protein